MSNTIGKIYSNFIKEKLIKDNIKQGIIPTVEEINQSLKEQQALYNNFNAPLTQKNMFYIEEESISSAEKMNNIFEVLESDLSVCVKSLLSQGNKMTDIYDSSYTKIQGFGEKVNSIQSRISDLLFESKNSDIHEDIFYERFESDSMVNMEESNVEIDDLSNSVNIPSSKSNVIPLSSSANNIEVRVENNPQIVSSADLDGLSVTNLVNITNNIWQRQISARTPLSRVYCEIIFTLPSSMNEINKVVLEPASGDVKTQMNLEISYSDDKLNWQFPDGESKKRLLKRTTFDFSNQTAKFWKIRLTKFGNDGFIGNNYLYNFGLKNLMFLGKEYKKVNRLDISELYSKVIQPKKISSINSASLEVCESKPNNTGISYQLAPITQPQINDINQGNISIRDLRYYSVDLNDRDSYVLDMLKLISQPTIDNILGSDTIEYKDKGLNDFPLTYNVGSDLSKSDTVVLRNAGDNTDYDVIGISKKIRDASLGWSSGALYYSTYVLIEEKDGALIDLGSTKMILNGDTVSGRVRIKSGLNYIASPKEHWQTVDVSSLPPNTDTQPDPLYPYNHKYLIEGIGNVLYGQDMTQDINGVSFLDIFDPNKVYRNKRKNWEKRMSEISFTDFESKNKSALDVFSYKVDNNTQERIVVKSTEENGLLNRERFSIITKIQNSNPVKGVILKATLTTEDLKTTPVLTEYLLKFR